MSEPAKNTNLPSPESYSPKKPRLAELMKENADKTGMKKEYTVKAANGGSYIEGIPFLKWGEWRDNSYCGCMTALYNAIGINVSYEEVMGLSGVCWQAVMLDNWDPSSQMPQNGRPCEKNVGDALGIEVYTLNKEKKIIKQAKACIDGGVPVLLVGGRWAPEWTLACGYAVENGEDKFFGRSYFDCQNYNPTKEAIEHQPPVVPENEIYTENGYFYFNGFPGVVPEWLTHFYNKKRRPISRKQALRVSLETCLKMFEQPSKTHKFGYDAYDVLISGFELPDSEYKEKCGNDCYHIGSMLDARRAAHKYLEMCAGLLEGENKERLKEVTRRYKNMVDKLLAAVPYEETSPVFNDTPDFVSATFKMAEGRRKIAAALRENKELERQARIIVKEILDSWEETK